MIAVVAALAVVQAAAAAAATSTLPLTFGASHQVDTQPPFGDAIAMGAISCPSISLCVIADDAGRTVSSTDPTGPASSWTALPGPEYVDYNGSTATLSTAISCPNTTLCVEGTFGGIFSSTNPTGGAQSWGSAEIGPVGSISCPSPSFCAAVALRNPAGTLILATDSTPTGGASSWFGSVVSVPAGPVSGAAAPQVSCASSSLCAITTGDTVETATNPNSGPWTAAQLGTTGLIGVSCPTASFCAAAGADGVLYTTTDPTGGQVAWTATPFPATEAMHDLSCSAALTCGAATSTGFAMSTNPAGGTGAWTVEPANTSAIDGLSCAATDCFADDANGNVLWTDGPGHAWTVVAVDGRNAITGLSCPSLSLCVGVDDAGNVLQTTAPLAGTPRWQLTAVDPGHRLTAVSCTQASLCVATDDAGDETTATAAAFTAPANIDGTTAITGVSCASGQLCVAIDKAGNALSSTNPAGGASTWSSTPIAPTGATLTGISCPADDLCVVSDSAGNVHVATAPATGGSASWQTDAIDPGGSLNGIVCATAALCIATDPGNAGDIFTTTDPTGGPQAWTDGKTYERGNTGLLACASTTLCVQAGIEATVAASNDPADPRSWVFTAPFSSSHADAVACAPQGMCIYGASDGSITIGVPPPVDTAPPTITGTPAVGSVLTCNPGTWTSPGTLTFRHQWSVGNFAVGAESSTGTLTVTAADAGETVSCTVVATNAIGDSVVAPDATVAIPLAPGTLTVGRARVANRIVRVAGACHAVAGRTCKVTVTLTVEQPATRRRRSHKVLAASSRRAIASGRSHTFALAPSRAARKLLANRPHAAVVVTVTIASSVGAATVSTQHLRYT